MRSELAEDTLPERQAALLVLLERTPAPQVMLILEVETQRFRVVQRAQVMVVEAVNWTEMCFVDEVGKL